METGHKLELVISFALFCCSSFFGVDAYHIGRLGWLVSEAVLLGWQAPSPRGRDKKHKFGYI